MVNPKSLKNLQHKGRIKGSGAMSIEEFRKILNKTAPNFIQDYIKQALNEPILARSIFDRICPEPKPVQDVNLINHKVIQVIIEENTNGNGNGRDNKDQSEAILKRFSIV